MRRHIGIDFDLIDIPMTRQLVPLWIYAIADGLDSVNETRFDLIEGTIDTIDRYGRVYLRILGDNLELSGSLDIVVKHPTL